MTVTAECWTLTGNTLNSGVTASSLTSAGNSLQIAGSSGVDISQGAISIKNGGAQSYVRFYCESSNAHYAQLQAPALILHFLVHLYQQLYLVVTGRANVALPENAEWAGLHRAYEHYYSHNKIYKPTMLTEGLHLEISTPLHQQFV